MIHHFSFQLQAQRAILGWLLLYPAITEREEIADSDAFSEKTFSWLEAWLEERCMEEIVNHEDPTGLADFLIGLSDEFADEAKRRVRNQPEPIRRRFEALGESIRQRAEGCRQALEDPVAQLDRWAREVAITSYEDLADQAVRRGIEARISSVHTSVIPDEEEPDNASPDWRVYACTRFPANGGPAWKVELILGVATDPRSWNATGYLLLHEYVSHCAQGPWTDACAPPSSEDLYAEGWMDVVAFLLHNANLLGGGSAPMPFDAEEANWRVRAANAYHDDRCERRERGAGGRHRGARIAGRFNRLLLGGKREPADEDFLRLSMQLNASEIDHRDRERFVRGVEAAIDEGAPLHEWVGAWRASGMIGDLVDPVLELVRARTEGRSVFNDLRDK